MVWMIVVIEFLPGSHFGRLYLSRCLLLIPAAWSIKCCVFGQENFSGSTATGVLLSRGWCYCQENVKAARNLAQEEGRRENFEGYNFRLFIIFHFYFFFFHLSTTWCLEYFMCHIMEYIFMSMISISFRYLFINFPPKMSVERFCKLSMAISWNFHAKFY